MDDLVDYEAKEAWATEALIRNSSGPRRPHQHGVLSTTQDGTPHASFMHHVTKHPVANENLTNERASPRPSNDPPQYLKQDSINNTHISYHQLAPLEDQPTVFSQPNPEGLFPSASLDRPPPAAVALDDPVQFESDLDTAFASFDPSQINILSNLNTFDFDLQHFSFHQAAQSAHSQPGPRSVNTISSLGSQSLVSAASSNSKSGDEELDESNFKQLEGHWKKAAFILHCLDTAKAMSADRRLSDLQTAVKKLSRAIKDVETDAKVWSFIHSSLSLQARELADSSTYLQFQWSSSLSAAYGLYLRVLEDVLDSWIYTIDPWISIPYNELPPYRKAPPSKYRNKLVSFRGNRESVQHDEEALRNLAGRAYSAFSNLKSALLISASVTKMPYCCPTCGEGFSHQDAVAHHAEFRQCHGGRVVFARRAHSSILQN